MVAWHAYRVYIGNKNVFSDWDLVVLAAGGILHLPGRAFRFARPEPHRATGYVPVQL
jgi:hypothetical protein